MRAFTVCLASPKESHYKQFYKAGAKLRILPVWSLPELLDAAQFMSPPMSPQVVEERYFRVGGIPRWIFQEEDDYRSTCDIQDSTLKEFDFSILDSIVGDFHKSTSTSHKIIAMHSHFPFHTTNVTVALLSDYIVTQYPMLKKKFDAVAVIRALKVLQETPNAATLAGGLYEFHCRQRLSDGGEFVCKLLSETGDAPESIYRIPKMDVHFFEKHQIPSSIQPDILYASTSGTFSAIDAFSLVDGKILMFQITLAKSHAISTHIPDLVKQIQARSPESYKEAEVLFFFLVPNSRFDAYSKLSPPPSSFPKVTYGVLVFPISV